VRAQEAELGFKFDYVVVCSVTGSTQAGMVVGFAADGRADRVIGIDASAKPEQTREQITRIARHTAELVSLGRDIVPQDVVLDTRYGGPEYGLPSDGTLEAIRLCARLEGMLEDVRHGGEHDVPEEQHEQGGDAAALAVRAAPATVALRRVVLQRQALHAAHLVVQTHELALAAHLVVQRPPLDAHLMLAGDAVVRWIPQLSAPTPHSNARVHPTVCYTSPSFVVVVLQTD
jgi:hypothetical protein